MPTRSELTHDGIDGFDGFDGDRPRGCSWERSVCTETPTHQVTYPGTDRPEAHPFCARHYVLELAYLVEVHMPTCSNPISDHVSSYGRID